MFARCPQKMHVAIPCILKCVICILKRQLFALCCPQLLVPNYWGQQRSKQWPVYYQKKKNEPRVRSTSLSHLRPPPHSRTSGTKPADAFLERGEKDLTEGGAAAPIKD